MMRHLLSWIILISILASCGARIDYKDIQFESEKELSQATRCSFDDLDVDDPLFFGVCDDYLLIREEKAVICLDPDRGHHEIIPISFGDGPEEVSDITTFDVVGNETYRIYDGNLSKIIDVNVKTGESRVLLNPGFSLFSDLYKVSSTRYLVSALGKDYSMALLDNNGIIIDSIQYFPPAPSGVSKWSHSIACTGGIAISPVGNYFARSVSRDGGIDFFKIINDRIIHVARKAIFDMDYDIIADYHNLPTSSEESRVGYFSLVHTGEKVLSLFSDDKMMDMSVRKSSEMHQYSKDGKAEVLYRLDNPATFITYDRKRSRLWLLCYDDRSDSYEILWYSFWLH